MMKEPGVISLLVGPDAVSHRETTLTSNKMKTTSSAGWKFLVAGGLAFAVVSALRADEPPAVLALAALRGTLAQEQGWIKVHAGEVLTTQGEAAAVHAVYLQELAAHGDEPRYRWGIRRTLALTSATPAERARWIEPIAAALIDPTTPDRVNALEGLGKLGPPHSAAVLDGAARWLPTASPEDGVFIHWLQAQSGDSSAWPKIITQLDSPGLDARLRAAFVLRRVGTTDPAALAALARVADTEAADSTARAIIVGGAYLLRAAPARMADWRATLDHIVATGAPNDRYEALQSLRTFYRPADLPMLLALLKFPHGDVRTGAAWAILTVTGAGH
ncbi:MAG: hypothetical protein JWM35_598 [Verrucomicrobia bacterium]|nr:hypothetical protein [Verrucomicrobiota bacterium]